MRRILNNERGATAVLTALFMVFIIGFAAIAVDYGNLVLHRRTLQSAVDAAVLAAAQNLPSETVAAQETVALYLEENAPGAVILDISFQNCNKKITLTASWDTEMYLARIFSSKTVETLEALGAAEKTSPLLGYDYALFSGNYQDLTFTSNANKNVFTGDVHSNSVISGSATVNGNVTANGVIDSKMIINGEADDDYGTLQMPDFSNLISDSAISPEVLIDYGAAYDSGSNLYQISASDLNQAFLAYPGATFYIDGNIKVNGSGVNVTGCMVAEGDIDFDGSGVVMDSTEALCLASLYGDLTFNGANGNFNGILYAGTGTVKLNGTGSEITGSVIGETVDNNGGFKITYDSDKVDDLPPVNIRLVE
jgi:Flp pilus assembly protein TadG